MGTGTEVRTRDFQKTNDKDLVQLAGDHAYNYHDKTNVIAVNGKKFKVIDTRYNTSSGLDALTVRNTKTKEISVVFVGSDQLKGDWIQTNLHLIGETEPAQLREAASYFREMEKAYGEVSHVTGNSLGGALANRVAIDYPHVQSVTLNPAMLPGGMIDPTKDYSNITNYQSEYDILTHVQEAIKHNHRIPGKSYGIHHGTPLFSSVISNHTGYVKRDENGEYKIEIGKEGKPGHGYIHVGADDHIVLSIWRGAPLHGGTNVPIQINVGDMTLLADGINNDVTGRLALAGNYISHAISIVDSESEQFERRVTALQEAMYELLDTLVADPLFKGASGIGNAIHTVVNSLISVLDYAEGKLLFLNAILNSAPAEFIEFVLSIDVSVETIFAPARKLLTSITDEVDRLIAGMDEILNEDIPAVFQGGKSMFVDAVVGELTAHYKVVEESKVGLIAQVNGYGKQVSGVKDIFQGIDQELGIAIAANRLPAEGKEVVPEAPLTKVPASDYLENNLRIKDIHVKIAHDQIKKKVTMAISPILSVVEVVLYSVEGALDTALYSINYAANVAAYNPVGLVMNLFTDYVARVQNAAAEATKPIYELQEATRNLKKGIHEANQNLPELLEYFEGYIDVAIFTPSKYHDVQLYNIASVAILNEMEMLFNDIVFQLSTQKAKAIEATVETSRSVLENIEIVKMNVEKGTK